MAESPKNTQEEYLYLHFITSLYCESIPVFEASLRISNSVVQMSHKLPRLKFSILEIPNSSYVSGLAGIGAGLNLGNIEYHLSVVERCPKLVLNFCI